MKLIANSENSTYIADYQLLIDPETGVNYIRTGHAMCPRYDSDGTLYISTPEEINNLQNKINNHI